MIGFPEFILDPKELDDVYDGVSDSRQSIIYTSRHGEGKRFKDVLCLVPVRRFRRQLLPEHVEFLQLLVQGDG